MFSKCKSLASCISWLLCPSLVSHLPRIKVSPAPGGSLCLPLQTCLGRFSLLLPSYTGHLLFPRLFCPSALKACGFITPSSGITSFATQVNSLFLGKNALSRDIIHTVTSRRTTLLAILGEYQSLCLL